jgi:hypothetical protein
MASINSFQRNVLLAVCMVLFALSGTCVSAEQGAEVTVTAEAITVTAAGEEVTAMMLRVVDPDGELVCDRRSDGSPISWSPEAGDPDGLYTWEVSTGTAGQTRTRDDARELETRIRPWRESGGVTIEGGAIVLPTEDEAGAESREVGLLEEMASGATRALAMVMDLLATPAHADQVFNDDVIAVGSLGVGQDSANGQDFGFDTLRFRENNLRIHFQDTSNSASFPSRDWRIIINDSTNGGASYFAIEDSDAARKIFTIEAGAPANSLYVEDYGRVGLGTATPVVELHIKDSDTPTVRLEQDGSGGWAPQTWDMAGNETNFFIRDVTNGSKLPFRIQPNTPSSTLCLKSGGNVGIGTWSPAANLEVETTSEDATLLMDRTDGAKAEVSAVSSHVRMGSLSDHEVQLVANDTTAVTIDTTGDVLVAGNLEVGSSRELKENIRALDGEEAMAALTALQPVRYNYKRSPEEETLGFIAEDVPDLVATKDRKSLNPMDMVAVLVKVTQEQQQRIEALSERIRKLEGALEAASGSRPDSL